MPIPRISEWINLPGNVLDHQEQKRVLKFIVVISLLLFVPFLIKNLVQGEYFFALLMVAFETSLLLEIYAISRHRPPYTSYVVPVVLLMANGLWGIKVLGIYGSYWLFPMVVSLTFLIPLRASLISNSFTIIAAAFIGYFYIEPLALVRFIAALSVTAIISHYLLRSITTLQHKLREASIRDAMTLVLNRSQLDLYMQSCLDKLTNTAAISSLALIDIDNFKHVNDSFGHDAGDHVIKSIAKIMQKQLNDDVLIFRLGGDEFLLLYSNMKLKDALIQTEKVRQRIARAKIIANHTVTISAGLAPASHNDDVNSWLKKADNSLYEAKDNGRNQVCMDHHQVLQLSDYLSPLSQAKSSDERD